jgi:HAD superfamily hydrolase (TIGR01509 family)
LPALLFDLDGTLIDSDPLHAAVFIEMFAERGITIDAEFYKTHIIGKHNAEIFGELFPGEDAAVMADLKEARFRDKLGTSAPPIPGLPALYDRAKRLGWPMAVVTNAPRENADWSLAAIGYGGAFDSVVLGDECKRGKPDPEPYLEAMRRLNVQPAQAIAFEDSPSGLRAARASGALSIGLRTSLDNTALRAAGAHFTIRDFDDPVLHEVLTDIAKGVPLSDIRPAPVQS